MLDRILLATDLSDDSEVAWGVAVTLVRNAGSTELPVVWLLRPPAAYSDFDASRMAQRFYEDDRRQADNRLTRHIEACLADGLRVRPCVLSGSPAESIAKVAREERADLVVLGMQHADVIDRLLGRSLVGQVTRLAPCHVLVVKPDVRGGAS